MKDYKIIHHIPASTRFCKATKMFTYPSKLLDTYAFKCAEINLPDIVYEYPSVDIVMYQGSTKSITKRILRFSKTAKLAQKFSNSIEIDNKYIYDARYCGNHNLSHLMVDLVSYLLEIKNQFPNLLVILPEKASKLGIKLLSEFNFETLCTNKHIRGKIIEVIVNNKNDLIPVDIYYGNKYSSLQFDNYNANALKKIFLARKGRRKLINETEVENFVKPYGFTKVYFEDIPFSEQWSIGRNAEAMIAVCGSAETNLLFNHNHVKVIELAHPGYLVEYWRMIVNHINGSWCRVTGEITEDILGNIEKKHNYYAKHDVKINLDSLEMAMKYMELT